ncbi:AraC family transcriptional regulator [Flavobacterium sp. 102]|uniref:AraC family transcriptional regulator n=1 Tax=Flavobacterium sp. 102 TaxID=2135623 RepID=UPI000EB35A24|nr:AraC family transcriptional regulator [Flavobacterium sp. 102]RKS03013.1 AraC family transcriptional regulator [Flavobacterium sp. 102]
MDKSTIKLHTISDILKILDEKPQSDGLHVYSNKDIITENPFSYPFRSDNFSVMLVVSGKLSIQLNLINYTLEANDFIIVSPKTVIHILDIHEGIQLIGISFTIDFALKSNINKNNIEAFDFFTSKIIPKLSFGYQEMESFLFMVNLLQKKNIERKNNFFGSEMISHTFSLLMLEIAIIYKKNYSELKIEASRKEELMMKFFKLLENNFKRERSLQFYADKLFVTTGHLTKVLKDVAGKTAGELIDDAVIMEARILLANPSLTISQIADELQFSDQSFFGKFFKKKIGASPSEYRKGKT